MSTNHIVKRPQVVVGQGVDPADFNNLAAAATYQHGLTRGGLMKRLHHLQGPTSAVLNPFNGDDMSLGAPTLYAMGHDGAPRNGATMNSYTCNAGMLYAVTGAPAMDGSTLNVPAYYLQAGEINGAFPIGDATHCRFDAVYVRLSVVDAATALRNFEDAAGVKSGQNCVPYKETKLEWLAVTGTPAAIPLIPTAPDATWALWGVWMTFKSQNGAHTLKQIFDYRVPIGMRRLICLPGSGGNLYPIGANCAYTAAMASLTFSATGSAGWAGASCPVASGRIMSHGFSFGVGGGGQMALKTRGIFGTGTPWSHSQSIYAGAPAGQPTQNLTDMDGFQMYGGFWINASGNTTLGDVNGLPLLPVWANGWGSMAEDGTAEGGGDASMDPQHVAMLYTPSSTSETLYGAYFDVAG